MLKGITYSKSNSTRALAVALVAVILGASFLAPFTNIVNGTHFLLRFDVEDYDLSYEVSYDGVSYDIDVHIPGELYYSYADEPRKRQSTPVFEVGENASYVAYAAYVVVDEVVQKIADDLKEIAESIDGGSDYCLASLILDFVHQTDYKADPTAINDEGIEYETEYPKTPVETLIEEGDCEDLSALFVSIALAADLDAVLFVIPAPSNNSSGHMAAGVHIDDGSEPSNIAKPWISEDGREYYFCETTSDRYPLGTGSYDGRYFITLTDFSPTASNLWTTLSIVGLLLVVAVFITINYGRMGKK